MAAAIVSMHYTGMAAVSFVPTRLIPDVSHAVNVSVLGTAALGMSSGMILVFTILTSTVDRIHTLKTLLDELFEQAPQAVVLTDVQNRVVRINREFTQMFGYGPEESVGRNLDELIGSAQSRDEVEQYADSGAQGQLVDADVVRKRKDGSSVNVFVIRVPVSVPSGRIAEYSIYGDISERKRADDALRELSGRLLRLQDDERRRLARDLHDSTGQKLAAIAINVSVVMQSAAALDSRAQRALSESLALTQECVREIRTLTYLLHPPELDELGLPDAITHYANGFAQRSGISVNLEIPPDLGRLPQEVETALFRIVQESLSNIHRHAGSSRARIHLSRDADCVIMDVEDVGHGIQQRTAKQQTSGLAGAGVGIPGMRERARQLGGRFEIHSSRKGTTLKVVLPLSGSSHAPNTHTDR